MLRKHATETKFLARAGQDAPPTVSFGILHFFLREPYRIYL